MQDPPISEIEHPEKTILVQINFGQKNVDDAFAEFNLLAESAGAAVVGTLTAKRQKPDPKLYLGLGKADELKQLVIATSAELVIVNHALSPGQERNLSDHLNCRVVDRHGLILDIFAKRARTFEGQLQVELALLQHLSTRLVRSWTHLERQKGGIGLRGPGETQLETDRRLLRARIKTIQARLERVKAQRQQNRRKRERAAIPTVALVGYTNAGKSTLFNLITQSDVFVANLLFATLDPTIRRLQLPGAGEIVLADTVGFINDLPHDLIEAFNATLEETRDADLLLHIIDTHEEQREEKMAQVESVLEEIGAQNIPCLHVYNKIDLVPGHKAKLIYGQPHRPKRVYISAAKNQGIELLKKAITISLYGEPIKMQITLSSNEGALRNKLYECESIIKETIDEQGNYLLTLKISPKYFQQLCQQHNHAK